MSSETTTTTTAGDPTTVDDNKANATVATNGADDNDNDTTTTSNNDDEGAGGGGDIPTFHGKDEKLKASDFANYFCSYAQLYHQKQMLQDHARMAAYHGAIRGNADLFRDKVVLDIGTGSGILAVWAAQAGARKVYAIEYTNMAHHAQAVVNANHVSHIVTVLQCAVEDLQLPIEQDQLEVETTTNNDNGNDNDGGDNTPSQRCVDIIVSEWMGYFLLRESMLDSIIYARDKYLKQSTGLLFPSHCTMYVAPITDEKERSASDNEYHNALEDWSDFCRTTAQVYGVNMSTLTQQYEKEQREYYLLSSRWTELKPDAVLADPIAIKHLDLMTCTLQDARGILPSQPATFDFTIYNNNAPRSFHQDNKKKASASTSKQNHEEDNDFKDDDDGYDDHNNNNNNNNSHTTTMISGIAGWFTADFRSRTDAMGAITAPKIPHAAYLSTGPENGYTHWGQQTFYLEQPIPVGAKSVQLHGSLEMIRTKENPRLYNCRIKYQTTTTKAAANDNDNDDDRRNETTTVTSDVIDRVYQIP